jgi:hypothetical protein
MDIQHPTDAIRLEECNQRWHDLVIGFWTTTVPKKVDKTYQIGCGMLKSESRRERKKPKGFCPSGRGRMAAALKLRSQDLRAFGLKKMLFCVKRQGKYSHAPETSMPPAHFFF